MKLMGCRSVDQLKRHDLRFRWAAARLNPDDRFPPRSGQNSKKGAFWPRSHTPSSSSCTSRGYRLDQPFR